MKINKERIIYFILFAYLLFLIFYLVPFFKSNEALAGWDTPTHVYSASNYPDSLIKGDYIYLDNYWFNGYAVYEFYPPFFFIVGSIIYLILFKLLSFVFIYKLLSCILVFLFVYALFLVFNKLFKINKSYSILFSIVVSFLWLFAPASFDYLGIGLNSIFGLGEVTNFLGIVIGLFLVTYSKLFFEKTKRSLTDYLVVIFLFSILLLSHIFSFFFFSFLVLFIFLQESIQNKWVSIKNDVIDGAIIILSTIVLCSFWLLPFLKNLAYSGAVNGGGSYGGLKGLFYLFLNNHLIYLPILILFIFGVVYLITTRKYMLLGYWFLSLAIFLRLINLNLTIHTYRLFAYIYLFYFIFAMMGIFYLLNINLINKKLKKYLYLLVVVVILVVFVLNIFFVIKNENGFATYYKFTFANYPDYNNLKEMILDIKEYSPNMVYAEQQIHYIDCYSSPHIFEYELARNNIPSLLGLYTESTSSSRFVFFPLRLISQNTFWLTPSTLSTKIIVNPDIVFDKLKLYNVDYLIVYSNKLDTYLKNNKDAKLIKEYDLCDSFKLYKLNNDYNVIGQISKKPFLIFVKDDYDWIITSQLWFESDITYNIPLIRSKNNILDSTIDVNKYSGIIISEKLYLENKNNLKYIQQINNISLNSNIYISNKSENGLGLKLFSEYNGVYNKPFNTLIEPNNLSSSISDIVIESNTIKFNVDSNELVPVLIRKSYNSFWKARNQTSKLTIYEYSPNFMLVYTTGKTELEFVIPWYYKLLFLFSIILFILISFLLIKNSCKPS